VSGARQVRALRADERVWLDEHLRLAWGSATIVSRGLARDASRLPAIVCTGGEELLGLATFDVAGGVCELVTIEAFRRREGIGSALLEAVLKQARAHACSRLLVVTTNDNLAAQRFYERHGLSLVAVHEGAVDEARKRKPEIPLVGDDGTPVRDELEMGLRLTDGAP
jgi:ribosomal protein S18 acetylase RimI-like enzyme